MPLTQFARDLGLTFLGTAATATRPTTWAVSLHTGFPGDTGTSILNEFVGGSSTGYVRTQLTGGNALALSSHILQNSGALTIGPATGTWQTATWMGICDAVSAGDLLAYMELSQSGATFFLAGAQFANPGSGYAVNEVVTLTSGGGATITVDAVATVNGVAGVITQWHVTAHGSLSAIPANPMASTASGSGTGATWLATWLEAPQAFTLNNGDTMTFASGVIQLAMA